MDVSDVPCERRRRAGSVLVTATRACTRTPWVPVGQRRSGSGLGGSRAPWPRSTARTGGGCPCGTRCQGTARTGARAGEFTLSRSGRVCASPGAGAQCSAPSGPSCARQHTVGLVFVGHMVGARHHAVTEPPGLSDTHSHVDGRDPPHCQGPLDARRRRLVQQELRRRLNKKQNEKPQWTSGPSCKVK